MRICRTWGHVQTQCYYNASKQISQLIFWDIKSSPYIYTQVCHFWSRSMNINTVSMYSTSNYMYYWNKFYFRCMWLNIFITINTSNWKKFLRELFKIFLSFLYPNRSKWVNLSSNYRCNNTISFKCIQCSQRTEDDIQQKRKS